MQNIIHVRSHFGVEDRLYIEASPRTCLITSNQALCFQAQESRREKGRLVSS